MIRASSTFRTGLFDEMIVDNFAGGGGASMGIEAALGRPCDLAINHDPVALAMHEANHPGTEHRCESVWDVDPVEATQGRPVGLAWFSPDCKHFSKAKGGKPVSKRVRGLAWVVIRWAKAVQPRVIMLENVEEFQTWGPLTPDSMPCPNRRGETFRAWGGQLRRLGYNVEWRELRACDYGAPTIRKRLFLIARCDGKPIVWPEPTHCSPADHPRQPSLRLWRTAAECIDWSLPCPSIFMPKDEAKRLGIRRPLAEKTLARIANGTWRYVINAQQPFIVRLGKWSNITGEGKGFRGQPLTRPHSTITSTNDRALVVPYTVGAGGPVYSAKPRSLDGPMGTLLVENHQALVAAFLNKHYGGVTGHELDRPAGSVTAVDSHGLSAVLLNRIGQAGGNGKYVNGADEPVTTITTKAEHCLTAAHLLKLRGTCRDGQAVDEPMPTVTGSGNHVAEVRAFLMSYYGNTSKARGVNKPAPTVTTRDRLGLVTVEAGPFQGEYRIVDIGMRMLQPRELYRAQAFPEDYVIDIEHPDPAKRGRAISKADQVRMCGNSVPPVMSEALVRANVGAAVREEVACG